MPDGPTAKEQMCDEMRTMQIAALREVLAWYADPENYRFRYRLPDGTEAGHYPVLIDGGDRARQLLGALV
jgi:hypothetical protein